MWPRLRLPLAPDGTTVGQFPPVQPLSIEPPWPFTSEEDILFINLYATHLTIK